MEDSFNVRVNKIFGSLLGSSSSGPWTLSDAEIVRREWNRDKGDSDLSPDRCEQQTPFSSSSSAPFNGFFSSKQINGNSRNPSGSKKSLEDDLEGLDDDDEEEEKERNRSEEDCEREELEIRSGIGSDCTLDFEVRVFFFFFVLICLDRVKFFE